MQRLYYGAIRTSINVKPSVNRFHTSLKLYVNTDTVWGEMETLHRALKIKKGKSGFGLLAYVMTEIVIVSKKGNLNVNINIL